MTIRSPGSLFTNKILSWINHANYFILLFLLSVKVAHFLINERNKIFLILSSLPLSFGYLCLSSIWFLYPIACFLFLPLFCFIICSTAMSSRPLVIPSLLLSVSSISSVLAVLHLVFSLVFSQTFLYDVLEILRRRKLGEKMVL